MPSAPTPEQWMDLVIAKAPRLRSAGVTSFTVDGVVIQLAPPEPLVDTNEKHVPTADDEDPLAGLPGFKRPTRIDE